MRADWAFTLNSEGAEPSRLRGKPSDQPIPAPGVQLWNVAIAEFAVAGGGMLLVVGGDAHAGGMLQREFDGLAERDRLGQQGSGREDEHRQ